MSFRGFNYEDLADLKKLEQHFMPEDVEQILKIPLPRSQQEDKVVWGFDKKGEFSVKSGYQLALKLNFPDDPSRSNSNSSLWKSLWTLDLPEKIKIFMWKASKNILPTAENLWKRKCIQDPIC